MTGSSLREIRDGLLADRTLKGPDWCGAYAAAADGWLAGLFAAAAERCGADGLALLAVGGYGRGSMAPGSDLDLLLVHGGHKRIQEVADAIWYPIWDSGIPLDHSVRTAREVRAAMDTDIKVALGLLDARRVAGDPAVAAGVQERAMDLWRTRTKRWLDELDNLTRGRHERFGDLAFLLEPDLKEARGGLRDVQLLRSLGRVAPVLGDTVEDRTVRWAERMLSSVRVELQRLSGQGNNVLLLQDQDAVAAALALPGTPAGESGSPADALMAAVADAARAVAWASDDGWRRVESWLAGPKGRGGGGDVSVEPGVVIRDGEVAVATGADPATDPSLALRLAAASAERDVPMARSALDRLAARTVVPEGPWPPAVLRSLLRLLGAGRPAIAAIETLDQRGIWLRYLPEWAPVRNRPQRNAYHRFTVDRHLLETVAGAARLQSSVHRPDLLLLGALFHDIGKGRGGDHTEIGISLVTALGPRLGLPAEDVAVLVSMVEHHLLLPDTATRRDLDDPATATAVAAAVGSIDTLELLAALTEADSMATGPAAWGSWKAGLVRRLVDQVAATLEGRPPPDTRRASLSPEEVSLLSSGALSVSAVAPEGSFGADEVRVVVAAPDQAGLLSVVAGMLTLSGLSVRAASTISDEGTGMALLRFEVIPAFDRLPDWDRLRTDIGAALDGRVDVDAQLVEREARYARYSPRTTAYIPQVRVIFDNDSSPDSTIVEVRAPDRGPVLHRVTGALSRCGLSITCALVSTLGAEAVDVFYLHGRDGGRVVDPAALADVEKAVVTALGA